MKSVVKYVGKLGEMWGNWGNDVVVIPPSVYAAFRVFSSCCTMGRLCVFKTGTFGHSVTPPYHA